MGKNSGKILVGLGVAVGALTLYSMKKRKEKPALFIKKQLPFGFNAMTIPPIGIFINQCSLNNVELLNHELVHWRQYQERGLFSYYVGYGLQKLKYGYDGMPMEHEARANENDYCRNNYTEAVRAGDAKTVYNPAFRT